MLKAGKGVVVPKLGSFTFSATHVDMAGTTNPDLHNRQERTPVFLVAKDFAGGVPLRTAIAGGAGEGPLRPFELKGSSGIIPQVKINYFEVATLTGGQATKDACRAQCELIYKKCAEQARKGEPVSEAIPHVGKLQVRGGLAGVIFDSSLMAETRGQTAKGFVDKLFATNNNLMNNKLFEHNPQKA